MILENWMTKLRSMLSARVSLFAMGLLAGSALTLLLPYLSTEKVEVNWPDDETGQAPVIRPDRPTIDLPTNARIEARIRYYLQAGRRRDLLSSYRRSGRYMSIIAAILEEYNMPQSLAYLPVLESRFLPHGRSRRGAVGLWQLMPGTASDYGLKYNRWIDERFDPEKATVVAVEYLKYLQDTFGNWELALAAYNCGPAQLKRIIRRNQTDDFWKLKGLPRETYNFVPNFYAILHILTDHEKYGVTLPALHDPLDYETIEISSTFSIDQIAQLAKVPPKIIRKLNPALLADIAPGGAYSIRVPLGIKEQFLEQHKRNQFDEVEITYTTHKIRRGETLWKIAARYGTTVQAIMADNHLRSSRWIKAGSKLRITSVNVRETAPPDSTVRQFVARDTPPEAGKVRIAYRVEKDGLALETVAGYFSVSSAQIKEWNPWLQSDGLQNGAELDIIKSVDGMVLHKTRRGDSLWEIARRHHTTVSSLKRWNQLASSRIYPGSNLIVALK